MSFVLLHLEYSQIFTPSHARGGGPVYLNNFQCTGSENRLSDCIHISATYENDHTKDVGVTCYGGMLFYKFELYIA